MSSKFNRTVGFEKERKNKQTQRKTKKTNAHL